MSGEHQAFADWLRERAIAAGYDFAKRGAISDLARDSGNDPAQMSRFLRGQAVPAVEGQRGLARALGLKLPAVMIAAGTAGPEDFGELTPETGPISLERAAELVGFPPEATSLFVMQVRPLLHFVRGESPGSSGPAQRDHTQRGVGGRPRAQSLKEFEQGDE